MQFFAPMPQKMAEGFLIENDTSQVGQEDT
jgi:hypothetical protein